MGGGAVLRAGLLKDAILVRPSSNGRKLLCRDAVHGSPACLTVEQTGMYLGFSVKEILVLATAKLLKLRARPAANGQKYFASYILEHLRRNDL